MFEALFRILTHNPAVNNQVSKSHRDANDYENSPIAIPAFVKEHPHLGLAPRRIPPLNFSAIPVTAVIEVQPRHASSTLNKPVSGFSRPESPSLVIAISTGPALHFGAVVVAAVVEIDAGSAGHVYDVVEAAAGWINHDCVSGSNETTESLMMMGVIASIVAKG